VNSFDKFFIYFLYLLGALALLLTGVFAVFQPKKWINFYLLCLGKKTSTNFYLKFLEKTKQKWFYFNLKLCGIVAILMALFILIVTINAIINT
jgi:hypothetical protein